MDPAPKISVYTILSPFEHWATLSCQSVSSKPHRLTTHKVLYDWVKITLPSIGSGSTKPFFPVMYFLSHNCTKTRKTPLSELLLVAVLKCFHSVFMGFGDSGSSCSDALKLQKHAENMLRHTWHRHFWRHLRENNRSACNMETWMASHWFGTVSPTSIGAFLYSESSRKRSEENQGFLYYFNLHNYFCRKTLWQGNDGTKVPLSWIHPLSLWYISLHIQLLLFTV